jgi:Reverse transcriptase (RNA-dependent DNA polymerase)
MNNMKRHGVIEIIERANNHKVLSCRWVLAKKNFKAEVKFCARFVVNGLEPRPDIDLRDTFSPTLNKKTLRLVMALLAIFHSVVHQMDVKMAFLHRPNDQYTLMESPPIVFEREIRSKYVGVLKKALYGLSHPRRFRTKLWGTS